MANKGRRKQQQQQEGVGIPACKKKRGEDSSPTVLIHPRVFDAAIRPVLRQIERDLGGITLDYEVIAPGHLPNSANDIRLTVGVTFQYAHSSNDARFDAIQKEVMTRFLAWIEDWEQMQGLPPTEGGWWSRPCTP